MWQPEPSWSRLPSGAGAATVGVWRAEASSGPAVVKRLQAPHPGDDAGLSDPSHATYWRREADVALDPSVLLGPGLCPAEVLRVEEDDEGVTIWTREVESSGPLPALFVARCLGRFAGREPEERPWLARRLLGDRLAYAERRDGWPTLARTPLADVAAVLWQRRGHWLDLCATAPAGRVHGDAAPQNFLAVREDSAVAVDWQGFGRGPLGLDLGYLSLSAREDFGVLLAAYLDGLAEVREADPAPVGQAARVMAVYTAFSRAEWALARVAPGEGALAGKFRHPSVAPHLRLAQRQLGHVEALLSP